VHFLEYEDDLLLEREDLVRQIADLIKKDYESKWLGGTDHPDHRATRDYGQEA
jgi:hypothetical protein